MDIAILGGTGDIGQGLALRWAHDTDHTVHIGSRTAEKADEAVASYRDRLADRGVDAQITGSENPAAAAAATVVVLAVPPQYVESTIESVAAALTDDAILVSPAVGMNRDSAGFHYDRPDAGSVTQLAASVAPTAVPVVGAFHNLGAQRLSDLDAELGLDTVVLGDDESAKHTVMDLTDEIDGLRAVDGGEIANAAEVEAVTPLLINVAMNNDGMHHLGVRFR